MAADAIDPRAADGRRFVNSVAFVTGAAQGIGRATVRRLAEEGATVVVADRAEGRPVLQRPSSRRTARDQ